MPPTGSRKRPAPGASPIVQQHQPTTISINNTPSQLSSEQYLQWQQQNLGTPPPGNADQSNNYGPYMYNGMNLYNGMSQPSSTPNPASTQITRRPTSQQLVSRTNYTDSGNESWPIVTEDGLSKPSEQPWLNPNDDLDQKAQFARRDTQAKRKQIPPFVQKLSR